MCSCGVGFAVLKGLGGSDDRSVDAEDLSTDTIDGFEIKEWS